MRRASARRVQGHTQRQAAPAKRKQEGGGAELRVPPILSSFFRCAFSTAGRSHSEIADGTVSVVLTAPPPSNLPLEMASRSEMTPMLSMAPMRATSRVVATTRRRAKRLCCLSAAAAPLITPRLKSMRLLAVMVPVCSVSAAAMRAKTS